MNAENDLHASDAASSGAVCPVQGGQTTENRMNSYLQDLRYAWRMLLKTPGFTLVAILTLALGIGANIAAFSIVDGILLRPLPVQQPGELVRVYDELRSSNTKDVGMSVPEYWDY